MKKPEPKKAKPKKTAVRRMSSDLPTAAVVRIAKNNGAERVGADGAVALVGKAEKYIADVTREAARIASHAGRKTIKQDDIDIAAQKF